MFPDTLFTSALPLAEASAFFIDLRKTASPTSPVTALDEFWAMPREEQRELLKEAGVTQEEFGALLKFAAQEVDLDALMAEEQEGAAAQEMNEAAFYRQKTEEAQQGQQALQEQLQAQQGQLQQLQQQVDGSAAQIQQAQQQAQLTQQAALTSVQAASAAATQATQQALQATDESLKHQQSAAEMRMAYQGMRGSVLDVVSQDPAAGIGAQLSGAGLETPPPGPEAGGMAQGEASGVGSADEASPGTETAPGADGATGASPATETEAAPDPQTVPVQGIKEAAEDFRRRLGGAAIGGALGGLGTALEAHRGHDDLRSKVQQLSASPGGGFAQALDLAKAKAQLALGDVAEQHPKMSVLAGTLMGAGLGASAGPEIGEQGSKLLGRLRGAGRS